MVVIIPSWKFLKDNKDRTSYQVGADSTTSEQFRI